MRTFLHFLLNEDQYQMRARNLPFAVLITAAILAFFSLFGAVFSWAVFEANPPTFFNYFLGGVMMLGIFNGVATLLGFFILALRVPVDLLKGK